MASRLMLNGRFDMIRVLFYASLVVLAISAALLYLPIFFTYVLLVVLVVLLSVAIAFKRTKRIVGLIPLLVIVTVFCAWGIVIASVRVAPIDSLAGKSATITGVITENPDISDDYISYTVNTSKIVLKLKNGTEFNSVPQHIKLQMTDILGMCAEPYDQIVVNVVFRDVGDTVYRGYDYSEGVYVTAYTTGVSSVTKLKHKPLYSIALSLRNTIQSTLYQNLSYEEASASSAILLGDKTGLPDEFLTNVQRSGVSHELAVSGMHFSVIFQLLFLFFNRLRIPKRFSAVILLFLDVGIMAVCGFSASIVRAGLTYIILLIGMLIFQKPDALNSLGCASLMICFYNPFSFGSIGFLLSYAATFGILFLCPLLYSAVKRFVTLKGPIGTFTRGTLFLVCQTLSATFMTMPIILFAFGTISVLSPITNIMTVLSSTVTLCSGILAVVLLSVPFLHFLAPPVLVVLGLSARYFTWCANLIGNLPFAAIPSRNEYFFVWLFLCICLILFYLYFKYKDKKDMKKLGISGLSAFVCSVLLFTVVFIHANREVKFSVLDVGKGVSVVLIKDGRATLIGAGDGKNDWYKISKFIESQGVNKIDLLVLPSLDKTFAGGAYHTIQNLKPTCTVLPRNGDYNNKMNYLDQDDYDLKHLDHTEITISNGIQMTTYADVGTKLSVGDVDIIISAGKNSLQKFANNTSGRKQIVVCGAQTPDKLKSYQLSGVILSGTKDTCGSEAKQLRLDGFTTYITASKGPVTVLLKDNKHIKFAQ